MFFFSPFLSFQRICPRNFRCSAELSRHFSYSGMNLLLINNDGILIKVMEGDNSRFKPSLRNGCFNQEIKGRFAPKNLP